MEKLRKQRKSISNRYEIKDKIQDGELVIEFIRNNEVKAKIILDILDDSTYVVEQSWSKVKGLGKFLYLEAANLVYPKFIVSDRDDLSNSALKVWKFLETVCNVEEYKDEVEHENSYNLKMQFNYDS